MNNNLKIIEDMGYDLNLKLNKKYFRLLLSGKKEEKLSIISAYEDIKGKLPSIDPYKGISPPYHIAHLNNAMVFLNKAKESFEKCTPLIEKLKKEDLNSEDKFELSNNLASAASCIDVLIN